MSARAADVGPTITLTRGTERRVATVTGRTLAWLYARLEGEVKPRAFGVDSGWERGYHNTLNLRGDTATFWRISTRHLAQLQLPIDAPANDGPVVP